MFHICSCSFCITFAQVPGLSLPSTCDLSPRLHPQHRPDPSVHIHNSIQNEPYSGKSSLKVNCLVFPGRLREAFDLLDGLALISKGFSSLLTSLALIVWHQTLQWEKIKAKTLSLVTDHDL